jgi:hypothetical protein
MSNCDRCTDVIDFDNNGGHIYPDGTVICPECLEIK